MAKNFDTRPLSSALGTEIIGLDVSDRIDEDTITELLDVWVDGIVLLFRKPNMTQEEQLRFAVREGGRTVGSGVITKVEA